MTRAAPAPSFAPRRPGARIGILSADVAGERRHGLDFISADNRREFDAAVESFDPEIEWVLPARQRADSCQGPEEIKRFWRGLDETFDELRLDPQEFVDAGDRVATRLRCYALGEGSGMELEMQLYHQVANFRDGKMVRIEYFAEWDEALEAAGLRS